MQPNSYWIHQSNEYDSNLPCLQDGRCRVVSRGDTGNRKRGAGSDLVLLECTQPSALFDGIIGTNIPGNPLPRDLLIHYTWQAQSVLHPFVAMTFDPPLEELTNVTLYMYTDGTLNIQLPFISMCVSSSPTLTPCIDVALKDSTTFDHGVVAYDILLLTPATSVLFLNITFEYEHGLDEWIFLSEVRVGGKQQQVKGM